MSAITISDEARKAAEAELSAAYTRRHIAAHEENEKGFACQISINSATAPLQKRIEELQQKLTTYEGRTNFCCECGGTKARIEELEKQLLAMRESSQSLLTQMRGSSRPYWDRQELFAAMLKLTEAISSTPADLASKYSRREVLEKCVETIEAVKRVNCLHKYPWFDAKVEETLTIARKELEK